MRNTSYSAARSPGKIILSGEHSVVYGAPALVAAIERYTKVWFTPVRKSHSLRTAFRNLSRGEIYPLDMISELKNRLDERFDAFVERRLPVQNILQRPDDLAIYTIAQMLHVLPMPGLSSKRHMPVPGRLSSESDLPLGAGMGSSAAVIAATIVLYEHFLGKKQDKAKRFEWVRFCERLQHGKGSATDAAAVIFGGVNRVAHDAVVPLTGQKTLEPNAEILLGEGWYWVLSGIPAVSTGECVAAVNRSHGKDTALWDDFSHCTRSFEEALSSGGDLIECVRTNHQLLNQIGVVSEPVNRFIASVEEAGGAAKISGAGATSGAASGVVLVKMDDGDAMKHLMMSRPEWMWDRLAIAKDGAHLFERDEASDLDPNSSDDTRLPLKSSAERP